MDRQHNELIEVLQAHTRILQELLEGQRALLDYTLSRAAPNKPLQAARKSWATLNAQLMSLSQREYWEKRAACAKQYKVEGELSNASEVQKAVRFDAGSSTR